ncbi:alpha/beta hydrolase-fold protein [uncultured Winogradskyella sp.]|uniref:alpha/beta hydrolase n=1 Tax=uncultured Winogradskyella sp. TaxID=395353 RepID=UPI0026238BCC|nr:alpha/beta hydrolase-fold protein [uncultured Winogradskyella sp.]
MAKFYQLLLLLLTTVSLHAQVIRETIESNSLDSNRNLKIQLPRNYNPKAERAYPLIVVLDGDYLFEPVAGNVDFNAYWEDVPDCIIVGVEQDLFKAKDFSFDEETNDLTADGLAFYNFIDKELIAFMDRNYKTSSYRVVVGHDLSANFMNYFLAVKQPIFRAFVALSPDLSPKVSEQLPQWLLSLEKESFYYLVTAEADIKAQRNKIIECDSKLKTITNAKLNYKFKNFEDANHYSLVGRGIPKALAHIFALYKPISRSEYKEKLLNAEDSPYNYLINKYEAIKHFYGFKKRLIENDIRAVAVASKKKNDTNSLENLALLIKKEFPNSMLGAYYMGMFYEEIGDYKKALLQYKSGLLYEPSQYIDKEIMLDKMYEAQDTLGN